MTLAATVKIAVVILDILTRPASRRPKPHSLVLDATLRRSRTMTRATFGPSTFSIAPRDSVASRANPYDFLSIRAGFLARFLARFSARILARIGVASALAFIAPTHPCASSTMTRRRPPQRPREPLKSGWRDLHDERANFGIEADLDPTIRRLRPRNERPERRCYARGNLPRRPRGGAPKGDKRERACLRFGSTTGPSASPV